ncbi:MAG TPA: hypothetical protein PLV24_03060 [Anaerolineaceae bacterium]|nr:hypothetical protein [Anaerolineaceae bacterium]
MNNNIMEGTAVSPGIFGKGKDSNPGICNATINEVMGVIIKRTTNTHHSVDRISFGDSHQDRIPQANNTSIKNQPNHPNILWGSSMYGVSPISE